MKDKTIILAFLLLMIIVSCGPKEGLEIGDKAPDLNYQDLDGNYISLSSLRGKLVLIDFWASWCLPCRKENPNLVNTYHRYKNQNFENGTGFTIYSISLDRDVESWEAAILKDSLVWENHVSDLNVWQSEAALTYNINQIPSNVMIDGDGIIIAKNLLGQNLELFLKQILAK